MGAAAVPAARQITLPLGTGRRCAARTMSGCAAATAASKMLRSSGRRSVIGANFGIEPSGACYPSDRRKRKPPQRAAGDTQAGQPAGSAADVGADDIAEQVPLLA